MKDTDDQILRRLDTLIKLLATSVCADRPQREKIGVLASVGLSPKEIAEFLGTTPNTVSVTLSGMRKEKGTNRPQRRLEVSNE
jgi:CRP-like cAMP-binding protein